MTTSGSSRSSGTAIARSAPIDAKGKLTLVSRNGLDLLDRFPGLDDLADAFESVPIIVDGEIVQPRCEGPLRFSAPARCAKTAAPAHLRRRSTCSTPTDATSARSRWKSARRCSSASSATTTSCCIQSTSSAKGKALFAQAKRNHLEGIIGKKRTSTYVRTGARRDWVKIKAQLEQEFVVGGWTDPRGSRKGFGSLLLGAYDGKDLRFVGAVGTGFSVKRIGEISRAAQSTRAREIAVRQRRRSRMRPCTTSSRSSSPKCALPSGRAIVFCGSRRFSACAKTRIAKDVKIELPEDGKPN